VTESGKAAGYPDKIRARDARELGEVGITSIYISVYAPCR